MLRTAIVPVIALACCVSACGGGGSGGGAISSTPTPLSDPGPPSNALIGTATTTQSFAVEGRAAPAITGETTAPDLLDIHYDATQRVYQIAFPGGTPAPLSPAPGIVIPPTSPVMEWVAGDLALRTYVRSLSTDPQYKYLYSSLADWRSGAPRGSIAFGIATPAGAVPTTGSASFSGLVSGFTNELVDYGTDWGKFRASLEGTIQLSFNFAAGTLSGNLSPVVYGYDRVAIPPLAFTNTLYAAGATTFSGSFATALPGPNSFDGRFTGPAAEELIGDLRFPYTSPIDSKTYDAAGAFVAKK
jgi:hypothetical protein